jgi:hypothetical protein
MKVGTGRGSSESLTTNLRSPARQGFRGFQWWYSSNEKKMRAYPSHLERFVRQTTSMIGRIKTTTRTLFRGRNTSGMVSPFCSDLGFEKRAVPLGR